MTKKPTKSAAYHESGHAAVAVYIGGSLHFVAAQPQHGRTATLANGYRLRTEGVCATMPFAVASEIRGRVSPGSPEYDGIVREVCVALGGVYAQARGTKVSRARAATSGGLNDFISLTELVSKISKPHRDDALKKAHSVVSRIIKRRWPAIAQLAEELRRVGFIDGDDAEESLRDYYLMGEPPDDFDEEQGDQSQGNPRTLSARIVLEKIRENRAKGHKPKLRATREAPATDAQQVSDSDVPKAEPA